jgi:hypothetical protein
VKAVLLAAVLSWMHTLAGPTLPKAAPAIADVIVLAVAEDTEPPVLQTRAQDAALMTKTVWNESHFELNPKPWKIEWTGLWCGPFQETCATMPPTLLGQARRALWLLHRGAESCPESPAAPYLGGCRGGEARREGDRRLTGALELVGGLAASPDEFALIL